MYAMLNVSVPRKSLFIASLKTSFQTFMKLFKCFYASKKKLYYVVKK